MPGRSIRLRGKKGREVKASARGLFETRIRTASGCPPGSLVLFINEGTLAQYIQSHEKRGHKSDQKRGTKVLAPACPCNFLQFSAMELYHILQEQFGKINYEPLYGKLRTQILAQPNQKFFQR